MTALSAWPAWSEQRAWPKTYPSQSTRRWLGRGGRTKGGKGRWACSENWQLKLINFNCYESAGGEPFTHQATSPGAATHTCTHLCTSIWPCLGRYLHTRSPAKQLRTTFPSGAFAATLLPSHLRCLPPPSAWRLRLRRLAGCLDSWLRLASPRLASRRLDHLAGHLATWLPSCACQERGGLFIHYTRTCTYCHCLWCE